MRLPLLAALLISTALPISAHAAEPAIDVRVGKLEKEMKAVQRKVFTGGDARFFEPEITAPADPTATPGIPATTPMADLTARIDALERELRQITGHVEQNDFKMQQLEQALAKFKGDTELRLGQLEPHTDTASTAAAASAMSAAGTSVTSSPMPSAPAAAAAPPASATPAPPSSGDAAEDAYLAGYRYWMEKKYPEAEATLKTAVAKYPTHRRASYAQNLLGRTYLDSGRPALAAEAFYTNYQKMPRGERAPDSLYFLGQSLVQLKKPKDACRVYDELLDVYGATISAELKGKVTKGSADAKCTPA